LESIAGGPVFGLSPVTQRILLSRVEAVNIVFSEPVRHWPSYCGERFVTIGIILGQEKSSTYSSEYASGFSRLAPLIWPHLLRLVTKAIPDRFLSPETLHLFSILLESARGEA